MTELARRIASEFEDGGTRPFSSFMAAALYDRERGYYALGRQRTGRSGDYYTSVSTGPLFGELMGREFCGAWERLGKPNGFTIIEAGANDGEFAADVLSWARRERPDFFSGLNYQIDEPLPEAMRIQQEKLAEFTGRVVHGEAGTVRHGCYFANELLDAIPFRRVRFRGGHWEELVVGLGRDGQFCWRGVEPEDGALCRRLEWLGNDFAEGYTTEVAPAVASQIRHAAGRIEQGYLFFADYGYPAEDYYAPFRTTGTLRCYSGHQAHEDPFLEVGETDITAHVDFSLVAMAAKRAGCEVLGFVDQGRFLTGVAAVATKFLEASGGGAEASRRRQFQTLTHPAHLGGKFHFLVLGKQVEPLPKLSGLTFARPGAAADLLGDRFRL